MRNRASHDAWKRFRDGQRLGVGWGFGHAPLDGMAGGEDKASVCRPACVRELQSAPPGASALHYWLTEERGQA